MMKKLYLRTIFIVFLFFFMTTLTSYGVSVIRPPPPGPGPPPPPPEDNLAWWCDDVNAEKVWGGFEDAKDVDTDLPHGGSIKVCIIDTGIDYNHLDLDDNYEDGVDFVSFGDDDPWDTSDVSHGTHVAGIIAMEDNEEGYIGIAPRVSLYVVRALYPYWDYDIGYPDDILEALDWAINDAECHIISMSFSIFESEFTVLY